MARVSALVPVVVVCAAAAAAQDSPARYRTGEVTYRQATLSFAPGGKPGVTPTLFLHFWTSGGRPFIGALEVRGGEGGNAYFDETDSGCILALTRLDTEVVEGSGACTGPFEGGWSADRFVQVCRKAIAMARNIPTPRLEPTCRIAPRR